MQKLFYSFFLISFITMAQNPTTKDIVGTYKLPNSNPEGGQSVIIFENNTFATFYFGGALKGTWKIIDSQVQFKTESNPKFYVYGRKLKVLKDSTQLDFSCETNSLVNLNPKTSDTMQPLFNEGANCFDYPYIHKTTSHLSHLTFAKQEYRSVDSFDIYKFEIDKKYNDIIVIGLPDEYTTESEFSALYKEGNLYFNENKPASKKPASIQENKEDKAYIARFMNKELIPETLMYGNEFFPNYDNPTEEQLSTFTRITPIKKEKGKIILGKNNLFTATCKD